MAPDKCFTCFVCIRSRKNHKPSHYFINSQKLTQVPLIRDLGVYINEGLTFVPHIKTVIQKASTRARLLNLSFTSKDKTILTKAFCVYVRPLLEYCSQVWNPHHKYLVENIESVQRRFTKSIPAVRNHRYLIRLKILGLPTLERRPIILDLCLMYKILHGFAKTDLLNCIKFCQYNTTRGHAFKIWSDMCKIDATKILIY